MVGTMPWPEPIRETHAVLFIHLVEDRPDRVLDDFVLKRGNTQRPLPTVGFRDVGALRRLRTIRPLGHATVEETAVARPGPWPMPPTSPRQRQAPLHV